MSELSMKDFADLFGGTPDEIATDLVSFSASAQVLSSDHPRLLDAHPHEWIGVVHSRVAAAGPTMKSVLQQLIDNGMNPEDAIIRFIDTEERTLIL